LFDFLLGKIIYILMTLAPSSKYIYLLFGASKSSGGCEKSADSPAEAEIDVTLYGRAVKKSEIDISCQISATQHSL